MMGIIKTFLTSVVLILIGVGLSFYGNKILNEFIDKNDPFIEVTATVIGFDSAGSEDGSAYTIYQYNVGGIDYKVYSSVKSTSLPAIGDTITLKYNPSNPAEVVFLNGSNYAVVFIGAGFILVGVFGLFRCIGLCFKSSKKKSDVVEVNG